ncbi:MAG: chromosomal replication initiator protein DnaA [Candidatus Latescibacteria bacterium]|nr:chromosomal replication initiator protein DnaA [Candidatus Latescibacterota bacterium]
MITEATVAGDVWRGALEKIQSHITSQTYETWFRSLAPLEYDGASFVLEVPSQFYVDWLDQHYRQLIESSLAAAAGQPVSLAFHVRAEETPVFEERPRGPLPTRNECYLSPHNTFETFIVGNGNQFAHAVAQAVAQSPGERYNPLFIYGGVGLGKTHLMHAIGHQVRAGRPAARIFFVSAEKFMNEMIYSIQHATTLEFKSRYRTADALLIDDIQFLAGKESTQEEFFHTFNTLHDAHKQIVLTSDGPPNSMTAIEERLVSRFTWGVVADLQAPDLETRVAIVKKKAELQGRILPNEIALLLASNIKTNIRDLEGSLSRLLAFSDLLNHELSVEFAQEVLREQIKPDLARVDVSDIQRIVARHFNVTEESIRGKRRTDTIAFPRQVGMYIARAVTDLSLAEIGAKFGGRDHTTVLHAYNKIEGLIATDREMRAVIEDLMASVST